MRRGVRVVALLAIALAVTAGMSMSTARADIVDGGFESGVLAGPVGFPFPPSFGEWTRTDDNTRLVSPPLPVHSGQYAAEMDTLDSPRGSYIVQDFDSGSLSYNWTFWVRPEAGSNVAELIYNWDRGGGYAESGTAMKIMPNATWYKGWGRAVILPPIPSGDWHVVTVVANRCTGVQDAYLDRGVWGRIEAYGPPPAGIATIILGDVAFNALQGLYYYDDVSFELWDCSAPKPNACPLSQGFWKTHPAKWPVDSLTLGGQDYSRAELLALLRTPPKGDASLILAHQLIAAKLNIANGSDPEPARAAIAQADALLGGYAGKLPYGVRAASPEGQNMTAVAGVLDGYNNGGLTPDCASSDDAPLPPRSKSHLREIPAPLGGGTGVAKRIALGARHGPAVA